MTIDEKLKTFQILPLINLLKFIKVTAEFGKHAVEAIGGVMSVENNCSAILQFLNHLLFKIFLSAKTAF